MENNEDKEIVQVEKEPSYDELHHKYWELGETIKEMKKAQHIREKEVEKFRNEMREETEKLCHAFDKQANNLLILIDDGLKKRDFDQMHSEEEEEEEADFGPRKKKSTSK